ncbi:Replication protein A 70 kDa DNA-binding subunit C [Linum perenne]
MFFFTDVIGVLIDQDPIKTFKIGYRTCHLKKLELQLLDGFCVKVAVWGKHATEVEDLLKKDTRVAEGKNILIITSTYVSLKKGITDLSSTGATKIYLNLDIPEAQSLKSLNGGKKPLAISNTIQMVTFKDLDVLKKDPGNKGKIYKIQCTIKDVDHGWFYWGCANDACLRRVEEGSENFICAFCNHKMVKPTARYKIKLSVFDNSGNSILIIMENEGVKYFNAKAQELYDANSANSDVDIYSPHPTLMTIVGKTYTFLITLTKFTMDRPFSEYTISQILDEVDGHQDADMARDDSSAQSMKSCVSVNDISSKATSKDHEEISCEIPDNTTIATAKVMITKRRKLATTLSDEE